MQVLKAMREMDRRLFRKHLEEFYPWFTKLICSDQVRASREPLACVDWWAVSWWYAVLSRRGGVPEVVVVD